MSTIVRAMTDTLGRLRDAWRFGQRAYGGRVYVTDKSLDAFRNYVADGLTPSKLKSLLRAVDGGDLATTLGLFEEMEAKDLNLYGVAKTRRGALTGLEWEVVSAAKDQDDGADKKTADQAAAFIEASFANLECFDAALEHMATAIGPNLAVLELVWDERSQELVDIMPIPSHRLRIDLEEPNVVRVVTADNSKGVPAVPPKFVVHIPHSSAGFPFSATLCHAQAYIYLIKLIAVADWGSYCETFGQPVRWATWQRDTTPDEKQEVLDMLKNMGSAAYGAFSAGVQLQFVESSQRGTSPYEAIINWCGRQQAIGWLGQNLTSDTTGGTGTFAAAKVQNDVRQDLLEDDVRRESRTIRSQIIAPMIAFKFPRENRFGADSRSLPVFRRKFREEIDRKVEAEIIAAAQRAGMHIPEDWAYQHLGIPKPEPEDSVLTPSLDMFGEAMTEDVGVAP